MIYAAHVRKMQSTVHSRKTYRQLEAVPQRELHEMRVGPLREGLDRRRGASVQESARDGALLGWCCGWGIL